MEPLAPIDSRYRTNIPVKKGAAQLTQNSHGALPKATTFKDILGNIPVYDSKNSPLDLDELISLSDEDLKPND